MEARLAHTNVARFKYELLALSIFNHSAVPFISSLFLIDPEGSPSAKPIMKRVQDSIRYKLRYAEFPPSLMGRSFAEAAKMTYLASHLKTSVKNTIKAQHKPVSFMLLGILRKNE